AQDWLAFELVDRVADRQEFAAVVGAERPPLCPARDVFVDAPAVFALLLLFGRGVGGRVAACVDGVKRDAQGQGHLRRVARLELLAVRIVQVEVVLAVAQKDQHLALRARPLEPDQALDNGVADIGTRIQYGPLLYAYEHAQERLVRERRRTDRGRPDS